jgi:hypothetical protein
MLAPEYRQRIDIHGNDVTRFNLAPGKPVPQNYAEIPFSNSTDFDLVILDAHRFDSGGKNIVGWEPRRLLISELIISFEYAAKGGVIVIRLSNPDRDQTVAILYILDTLCQTVKLYKPETSHNHRGSFYAVASGFGTEMMGHKARVKAVTEILRGKWWEATFGGEDGKGINPGEWWDEIIATDKLPELFGETLVSLALPVWATQIDGLKAYFAKYGILGK